MDPIARMVAAGAAGVSGSSATYVDDVFSTFLYQASGTTQAITNGIDLDGEGGMVWIKNRANPGSFKNHVIVDTERIGSSYKSIYPNLTEEEYDPSSGQEVVTSVSSNGFTRGNNANVTNGENVAWTFRKAPGFFDVVTYTGSGANRSIAHSLGSVPGCIMIKCTSRAGDDWIVYHRSLGNTKFLNLNQAYGASTDAAAWNSNTPTSSVFYLGTKGQVNTSGQSYVAYIFAHDDQSFGTGSDESIIKCGSFSTDSSALFNVNLGFEPQWLMYKRTDGTADWAVLDIVRDWTTRSLERAFPNTDQTPFSNIYEGYFQPYSRGFRSVSAYFSANTDYIYVAIRRPNKPPEDGTDVFAIDTSDATSPSPPQFTSGFLTDFIIRKTMNGANATIGSRLQGIGYMSPYSTNSEGNSANLLKWDFMDGWSDSSGVDTNLFCYMFKRAPGFFDVVTYNGTGSTTAHNHNLEVTPELFIVKNRSHPMGYTFLGWPVYNSADGASEVMQLNATDYSDYGNSWAHTAPTSTTFTTGTGAALNSSGATYVAYLFASLAGISKVGTYTGTGSAINVDCGFTAGARFVMIKRRDTAADWYVWDTTNGIVSGNDPYWRMNDASAAVTNTDYIDPLNAGFTVAASGQGDINANGGTYLFLAIA